MDAINNPYAPGAGTRPVELAGRDSVIERVDVALGRRRKGRPAQHPVLIGLRGVGKTVLLDTLHRRAVDQGFACVRIEAPEGRALPELLAPQLRAALLRLDRGEAALQGARRALGALRNFAAAFKLKFGELEASITAADPGVADSGDLDTDLGDLFVELGLAARERRTAFVLFLDELQYLPERDLGALIAALHHAEQREAPLGLVAAGLPLLPGQLGDAKSYAERMFKFESIGALDRDAADRALTVPAEQEGVAWTVEALEATYAVTQGYPYFLQEWGAQSWQQAQTSPITAVDVTAATPIAIAELDASFFRVRLDRLSPGERRYLRAMAALGDGPIASSAVAERLTRSLAGAAPTRDTLIRKGMIYSPERGSVAFTVPLFGDFMRRAMQEGEGG